MGSFDGLTKTRMLAIEAASVVSGLINGSGHLILTKHDNSTIDAGNVVGPTGLTPDLRGLSTSSITIGTGNKTFAINPAMAVAFPVGATVKAQGVAAGNYMVGLVTAATPTSVTINVSEIAGSGTFASWTLVIGSFRGTDGVLTGAAGGDLAGAFPNPTIGLLKVITGYLADGAVTLAKIADSTITDVKIAAANKDGAVGVPSMRTLGTGALQAAAGNDARLRTDTGWVDFTASCTAGDPPFASAAVTLAQYRKIGALVHLRVQKSSTAASDQSASTNGNYGNMNILGGGSIPTVARPDTTAASFGKFDDAPVTVNIPTAGNLVLAGGMARNFPSGNLFQIDVVYMTNN